MKTLTEVWKNSGTLGIFSRLEDDYIVPWMSLTVNTNFLNLQYHFNRSGMKPVSPLVLSLLENGELQEQGQKTIAGICWQMFNKQWQELFDTLEYQYNAINNYDMTETGTDTTNGTRQNTGTHSNTGTSVDDGEDTTQFNENNTNSLSNNVYAFNSQTAVPSDTSNGSDNNSSTTTTVYGKENTTTENGSDSNTETEAETVVHSLTRSGNIGVMSTQDLIKQQREVVDFSYFEKVMRDIDTVLCLDIY